MQQIVEALKNHEESKREERSEDVSFLTNQVDDMSILGQTI
jgi:hypothetical protein